jgi:rhomboid protease GluP
MTNFKQEKAYTTYILILINLFFFRLKTYLGGSENIDTLEKLGALVPEKVWLGEWWRLLSANFLHFDWLHLITNMLGLYFIGRFVEKTIGSMRYLVIYFMSGLLSMLFFTILTINFGEREQILVGASAAIMGLVGAIAAIFLRDWDKTKSRKDAQRLNFIFLIIIIQFTFDFSIQFASAPTTPQVSILSHALGLVIGFLFSLLLLIK